MVMALQPRRIAIVQSLSWASPVSHASGHWAVARGEGSAVACFTLFMKIIAFPLGIMSLQKTFSIFEAFLDRVPRRCVVAAKHVVLVLMLQAAAGSQGISCAPVDLFLLVPDV